MMQQNLTHAIDAAAQPHFENIRATMTQAHAAYQKQRLPHMTLAEKTDDLPAMQHMADALGDGAARILILGTGGSSLGAQVLAQTHGALTPAGQMSGPELVFVDNLDAETYTRLLGDDLATSRFLVVSKSGGTAETMMQAGGALLALENQGLTAARHMGGIAGRGDNALRRLAATYGFSLLDHEDEIGGRFSVFTNVGLLPALWAGGHAQKIRAGAAAVMDALSGSAGVTGASAATAATASSPPAMTVSRFSKVVSVVSDILCPHILAVHGRDIQRLGRLRLMRMFGSGINFQIRQLLASQWAARQHALHGHFHDALRKFTFHDFFRRRFLNAARITGMAVIFFVAHFLAGKLHLISIDDNDIVAAIHMRGESRQMLATQTGSDNRRQPPDNHIFGINENPLLLNIGRFCRICFHLSRPKQTQYGCFPSIGGVLRRTERVCNA